MGEGDVHGAFDHLLCLRIEFEAQAIARRLSLGDRFDVLASVAEEVEAVLGQKLPLSLTAHIVNADHNILRLESGFATSIRCLLWLRHAPH